MIKKSKKTAPLTLHGLLTALSYWGSSVRLLLATFVGVTVFFIALSETSGAASAVTSELVTLLYVLGSIAVLDLGYVIISRALPLRRTLDVSSLAVADLGLAALYAMPKIIVTPYLVPANPVGAALLIAVLVLAIRLLMGILFSSKKIA